MGATAGSAGSETDRPQRWARPFVAALLAAFVVCGVFGVEAWPLSGFRLFSAPRGPVTTAWRLYALDAERGPVPVNVSRLGPAYRGFGFVARTFAELPFRDRSALCAVWARAVAGRGIDAVGFHVVRVEQQLVPRDEDGPLSEPRRTVTAACVVMRG